jgi:general secretion pathway protein C
MNSPGWLMDLKSAQGRQAALAEYGPRAAVMLLGALFAIQAGFLVTGPNAGSSAADARSKPSLSPFTMGSTASVPALRVDSIINAHLFGEARGITSDDAPQTSAALVLAGVLAVPDPQKGMAIIGPSAGAAKLYAVGASVPGGVRLHAVYPDRVLLDRNGVLESLMLPKKLSGITTAPAPLGQSPAQRLAALATSGGGGLLGGLVRAQAVFSGGKLSGYRIFPGGRTNVAAFTQLGLRPGDLVTAVNGTPLDDPNRANDILQTLSSMGSANVTVQRNGQPQDISLNLEAVANDAESAASQGSAAERRGGAFGGPLGGGSGIPGLRGSVIAPAPADPAGTPPSSDEPIEHATIEQ